MKHCIVTMEIAGPTKTGGIGTHCFYLAKFLREQLGHEVTLLLTAPLAHGDAASWKKRLLESCGAELVLLEEQTPFTSLPNVRGQVDAWFHGLSLNACAWLKEQDFDVCHFQETNANGFASVQAKRQGLAFQNTFLTTVIHSPLEWIREANQIYTQFGGADLVLDCMERYSAEHSDFTASPTRYMLDWTRRRGWRLPENSAVLPLLSQPGGPAPARGINPGHLIFFGRLETRKGLEIFVKSLALLSSKYSFYKYEMTVTFLGKPGEAAGMNGLEYLKVWEKDKPPAHRWIYQTELDHFQAAEYLKAHSDALVVIPSPVDNSPYTVIESLEMGLNVIAASEGGIPELFGDSARLFQPSASALAEKIARVREEGLPSPGARRYTPEKAQAAWRRRIQQLEKERNASRQRLRARAKPPLCAAVAVTASQFPASLERALDSLANQTCSSFKAVVVLDARADEAYKNDFHRLRERCAGKGWIFLETAAGLHAESRNAGAAAFQAPWLYFMDTGDIAEPHLLETMLQAAEYSRAALLMPFVRFFAEPEDGSFSQCFMPCGGFKEIALHESVFDPAGFLVRRDAFIRAGGFNEETAAELPDWSLHLKLLLAGEAVEAVPEFLLRRGRRPGKQDFFTENYAVQTASLAPCMASLPPWKKRLVLAAAGLDRRCNYLVRENQRLERTLRERNAEPEKWRGSQMPEK